MAFNKRNTYWTNGNRRKIQISSSKNRLQLLKKMI